MMDNDPTEGMSILDDEAIDQIVAEQEADDEAPPWVVDSGFASVRAALENTYEVDDRLKVPMGYALSRDGVEKILKNGEARPVSSQPVIIEALISDSESGEVYAQIAWRDNFGWKKRRLLLNHLMRKNYLEDISRYGLDVSMLTSKDMCAYLQSFLELNRRVMPSARLTDHYGWQTLNGRPCAAFLVGTQLIGGGEDVIDIDQVSPTEWGDKAIALRSDLEGTNQQIYAANGSIRQWRTHIGRVARFPHVRLGILAALAPPLLEIMSLEQTFSSNFIIDFSNPTSTGKTNLLYQCASVWGRPTEREAGSPINTWDVTPSYIESLAAVRSHLPVFLDDSKRAQQHKDAVSEIVYLLAQGQGRGRGKIEGHRRMKNWRTVVLSTGESRLIDFGEHGGTRARVITVWGLPYGEKCFETGELLSRVYQGILSNYGHAGPAFVRWLHKNIGYRRAWAIRKDKRAAQWRKVARQHSALARQGDYYALLDLTEWLAHQAGILPWDPAMHESPIKELWGAIAPAAMEANRSHGAIEYLRDWARQHDRYFYRSTENEKNEPHEGWYGRIEGQRRASDRLLERDRKALEKELELAQKSGEPGSADMPQRYIAFVRPVLEDVLRERGYEPESIIRSWAEDGFLSSRTVGRSTRQLRVGSGTTSRRLRMLVIDLQKFDADLANKADLSVEEAVFAQVHEISAKKMVADIPDKWWSTDSEAQTPDEVEEQKEILKSPVKRIDVDVDPDEGDYEAIPADDNLVDVAVDKPADLADKPMFDGPIVEDDDDAFDWWEN